MDRHPWAAAYLTAIVALALAAALILLASAPPAQAQTPTFKIEGSYSGLPLVYEGAQVQFKVTRTGPGSSTSTTVEIETWEPNLEDGAGNNPSLQTHQVRFVGSVHQYFSVTAYVDGTDESAEPNHTLKARLAPSSDGSYSVDTQNEAEHTILDPPAIWPAPPTLAPTTHISRSCSGNGTASASAARPRIVS